MKKITIINVVLVSPGARILRLALFATGWSRLLSRGSARQFLSAGTNDNIAHLKGITPYSRLCLARVTFPLYVEVDEIYISAPPRVTPPLQEYIPSQTRRQSYSRRDQQCWALAKVRTKAQILQAFPFPRGEVYVPPPLPSPTVHPQKTEATGVPRPPPRPGAPLRTNAIAACAETLFFDLSPPYKLPVKVAAHFQLVWGVLGGVRPSQCTQRRGACCPFHRVRP